MRCNITDKEKARQLLLTSSPILDENTNHQKPNFWPPLPWIAIIFADSPVLEFPLNCHNLDKLIQRLLYFSKPSKHHSK